MVYVRFVTCWKLNWPCGALKLNRWTTGDWRGGHRGLTRLLSSTLLFTARTLFPLQEIVQIPLLLCGNRVPPWDPGSKWNARAQVQVFPGIYSDAGVFPVLLACPLCSIHCLHSDRQNKNQVTPVDFYRWEKCNTSCDAQRGANDVLNT